MNSTMLVLVAALTLGSGGQEPTDSRCYGEIVACAEVCRYLDKHKCDACLMRCIADYQTCVKESEQD